MDLLQMRQGKETKKHLSESSMAAMLEYGERYSETTYGKRHLPELILQQLPNVGEVVKMREVIPFSKKREGGRTYDLTPYPRTPYSSGYGGNSTKEDEEYIWQVTGYTEDKNDPYKRRCNMKFKCVNPKNKNHNPERSVPAYLLACGNIRCEIIHRNSNQAEKEDVLV